MPKPLSHNGLVILRLRQSKPRETYAGLLYVKADKGYSSGWVAHKFKEIFGGWPRPQAAVEPQEPSEDLREWLGIERRRYRARMKRIEAKTGVKYRGRQAETALMPAGGNTAMSSPLNASPPEFQSELMAPDDWDVAL